MGIGILFMLLSDSSGNFAFVFTAISVVRTFPASSKYLLSRHEKRDDDDPFACLNVNKDGEYKDFMKPTAKLVDK